MKLFWYHILWKIDKYVKTCKLKCEEKFSTINLNMEQIKKLNEALEDEKEVFAKNDIYLGWRDRVLHCSITFSNTLNLLTMYR